MPAPQQRRTMSAIIPPTPDIDGAPTECELMRCYDTDDDLQDCADDAGPYDLDDTGHSVEDWRDYHGGLGVQP